MKWCAVGHRGGRTKYLHPPSPIGHVGYTRDSPAASTRVQETLLVHGERMDVVPTVVEKNGQGSHKEKNVNVSTSNLRRSYMAVNDIVHCGFIMALLWLWRRSEGWLLRTAPHMGAGPANVSTAMGSMVGVPS